MTNTARRDDRARAARANGRVGIAAAGLAVVMLGAAFAAVPFYRWFCATTGYGGTPLVATAAPTAAPGRSIEVRFDTNVRGALTWSFHAEKPSVTVPLGETVTVNFRIENKSTQVQRGVAAFNVTPALAAPHFMKLACFCFEEQTLKPGEVVEAPVTFWVDRDIDTDKNVAGLSALTLSYSFFPVGEPQRAAEQGKRPPETTTQPREDGHG